MRSRFFPVAVCLMVTGFLLLLPLPGRSQHIDLECAAPGPEARGLTWDGEYIWCADASLDSIFQIDPSSGNVVHAIAFDFLSDFGGGIAWGDDTILWVTRDTYFYRVDASSGQRLFQFEAPG